MQLQGKRIAYVYLLSGLESAAAQLRQTGSVHMECNAQLTANCKHSDSDSSLRLIFLVLVALNLDLVFGFGLKTS